MTDVYSPAGANVDEVSSTKKFGLGQCGYGQDGQEYVYVQAGEALTLGAICAVDENFQAVELTTSNAVNMHAVAWAANIAFSNDDFGWLTVKGTNFSGLIADDSSADSPLYTTSTGGTLSSDASTGNPVLVAGVTCVSVASGGGASELIASWPRISELDTAS